MTLPCWIDILCRLRDPSIVSEVATPCCLALAGAPSAVQHHLTYTWLRSNYLPMAVLSSMLAQPPRALLLKKPCLRASRLSTRIVPQALNKTEFVAAVRDSIESTPGIESLTNPDFDKIVSGVFDTIQDTVADGESITITGFGKFERRCCCFPSFSGFTHY